MSRTQDADRPKTCDPCKHRDCQTTATVHCHECSENLCNSCKDIHGSLKATLGHTIYHFDDNSEKAVQNSGCRTKEVSENADETKIMTEKKNFLLEAKSVLKTLENIEETIVQDKKEAQISAETCRGTTKRITLEIIEWADRLRADLLRRKDAEEMNSVQDIEKRLETSKEMINQLKDVIYIFEQIEDNPEATFVSIEKEQGRVNEAIDVQQSIMKEIQPQLIKFGASEEIQKVISEVKVIGRLDFERSDAMNNILGNKIDTSMTPGLNFLDIQSATKMGRFDAETTYISGCTFLSNGELVICDNKNEVVSVLTTDFKMKNSLKTGYKAFDITSVSKDEVVVTDPGNKQIQFLNILETITKGRIIPVEMECYGLDYKNDLLYITGYIESSTDKSESAVNISWMIKLMSLNGVVVNSFTIGMNRPKYIAVNSSGNEIVGSNGKSSVFCSDTNGTIIYTYSDAELYGSRGVVFDSYDNFMVVGGILLCSLHVVKKDGSKHKILLRNEINDELVFPQCIAYRESDAVLVIGQCNEETPFLVFKLNKTL